jgi:hypothetical protein
MRERRLLALNSDWSGLASDPYIPDVKTLGRRIRRSRDAYDTRRFFGFTPQ